MSATATQCFHLYETVILRTDRDRINPDERLEDKHGNFVGLEMSRADWQLIVECLDNARFASSMAGGAARRRADELSQAIISEFIAHLPEEVA